jgi:uncharacterized membrane protein
MSEMRWRAAIGWSATTGMLALQALSLWASGGPWAGVPSALLTVAAACQVFAAISAAPDMPQERSESA